MHISAYYFKFKSETYRKQNIRKLYKSKTYRRYRRYIKDTLPVVFYHDHLDLSASNLNNILK